MRIILGKYLHKRIHPTSKDCIGSVASSFIDAYHPCFPTIYFESLTPHLYIAHKAPGLSVQRIISFVSYAMLSALAIVHTSALVLLCSPIFLYTQKLMYISIYIYIYICMYIYSYIYIYIPSESNLLDIEEMQPKELF